MEILVDLHFNFGGTWRNKDGELEYDGGDVDILSNFDIDYLCYSDIKERYIKHLGLAELESIFVLQPGKELSDGLLLVDDDESIRKVLYHINQVSWATELQFYAKHDVDDSLFRNVQLVEPNAIIGAEPFSFMNSLDKEGQSYNEIIFSDNGRPAGYVSEEVDDDNREDERDDTDSSDEECRFENGRIGVTYDSADGLPHFILGMTFADAKEARAAISNYSVSRGVILKLKPNEPYRIRAKCKNEKGCPFTLFISKDGRNPGLVVKTILNEHKCFREFKIPQASARFLARTYKEKIQRNPNFRVKDMKDDAELNFKLHVTYQKCKRAKKMVMQELNGSYKSQFGYLEAYAEALKRSNPGTKAEIELCKEGLKEGKRIFKRIFIMFHACKVGWKSGCRPIIGLDGCFLKGVCRGQLLAAVGVDANGQMFPIAWAIIDKENTNNWTWFICWLAQELELGDGSTLTIISDMQKVKNLS